MLHVQGPQVILTYVAIAISIIYVAFTQFTYYSSLFTSTSHVPTGYDRGLQLISHTIMTNASLPGVSVITVNAYTHCFVTAFMDLDRHLWNDTPRATQEYMTRFACHTHPSFPTQHQLL